ncbi:citrate synthase family protein [Actinoplanes friuliensis]|uniref:citrate synthase (unknown stereospecificity) n=1 Tax=Actinoplanes friuliensis DSM 7358 TaxID=1246995 RepID=U5VXW6_9ACTN|nr:citrate synthase family protein [Actinoplanes friuliensis]AGZ41612.1 citrate synthase [Actinoplanes friuliensis DSM 7358]
MTSERLLTTDEVARRLGVKKATVYAYVSRGLLASRRNADGKESLFAEPDVAAFAAGRRRQGPVAEIHTGLTLITGDELFYRGRRARDLAAEASYESVATLLWTGHLEHVPLVPTAGVLALAEAVSAPLPPDTRPADRLRVVVAAAGSADRMRFDTTPAAVVTTARTLLGTMVAALPERSAVSGTGLAEVLWSRLSDRAPAPAAAAGLNAALVLLADHDLAASTFAARVAASTRAHPYAVVGAGLAALDGPLHGAASTLAYALVSEAVRTGDVVGAISDRLRADGWVPGFGHLLYPGGDPRATALLDRLPADGPSREVLDALVTAMADHSGTAPNIDFALAAFALLHGLGADAGEVIFAVARTAGWIAHALEEYADQPSRFRPSGRYAGRTPQA